MNEYNDLSLDEFIERSMGTTCGNPFVEDGRVDDESRAALARIAVDVDAAMDHRNRAVYLLGMWPDDQTVALIDQVRSQLDERGRIAAASILGRIGTKASTHVLRELASDQSDDVRRVGLNSLARIDRDEARAVLRDVATRDPSSLNRARAAELLG